MSDKYKEIKFTPGQDIESAVQELKKNKGFVCGDFNGKTLYSDIDDLDSAYKKVTGKTKSEFDAEKERSLREYEELKRNHKELIPQLTGEWVEKGKRILDNKYHEIWAECVPIRLDDLYQGMELGCTLDIVEILNKGGTLDEAKATIEDQGHSGMSFGLVCSMVDSFCDRGTEFNNYVRS